MLKSLFGLSMRTRIGAYVHALLKWIPATDSMHIGGWVELTFDFVYVREQTL